MPKRVAKDGSKALEAALKELHGAPPKKEQVTECHLPNKVRQNKHKQATQNTNRLEEKIELCEDLVDEITMERKKPLTGDRQRERALLVVQCAVHKQT